VRILRHAADRRLTEASMFTPRSTIDLTGVGDALLCVGAAAYFLGFFAAVHTALGKLFY
jgi:hypothetical protein